MRKFRNGRTATNDIQQSHAGSHVKLRLVITWTFVFRHCVPSRDHETTARPNFGYQQCEK